MNDGFMRSLRFFINYIRASISGFLVYPVIVCFLKWIGKMDEAYFSVQMLITVSMVFLMGMQHYLYFYKTSKSFSITGKNFHAACHVNILLWSVTFAAMAWLIRCLISFYEFTPHMLGIVFLSSIFFGFLGEFCGIILFKRSSKLSVVLYIASILSCLFYSFLFAFVVFDSNLFKINIPTDTFLLASAVTFPVLSVIFLAINGLVAKNLEIRS